MDGSTNFFEGTDGAVREKWTFASYENITIRICTLLLVLLFAAALLAPWLAPHDPVKVDLLHKLEAPSTAHWLGTDHLGRDTLSRLLYGSQVSLGFALVIFIVSVGVGLIVGAIAGYVGGWIDSMLMRF